MFSVFCAWDVAADNFRFLDKSHIFYTNTYLGHFWPNNRMFRAIWMLRAVSYRDTRPSSSIWLIWLVRSGRFSTVSGQKCCFRTQWSVNTTFGQKWSINGRIYRFFWVMWMLRAMGYSETRSSASIWLIWLVRSGHFSTVSGQKWYFLGLVECKQDFWLEMVDKWLD